MTKTPVDDHLHFYDKTDEELVRTLIRAGIKVRTAESCTGGGLMNRLTDVAGSSRIMDLSVLAYSPQVKQRLLRVPAYLTTDVTIVSQGTAECMRKGLVALSSMLAVGAVPNHSTVSDNTISNNGTCTNAETRDKEGPEAPGSAPSSAAYSTEEPCWYVGITGWLGPAPLDAGPGLSDTVFVSLECTLLNYAKTFCFSTANIKSETLKEEPTTPSQSIDQDKATKKRAVVHRILLELAYSTTDALAVAS